MPSLDPPQYTSLARAIADVIEAGRDEPAIEVAAVVLDTIVGEVVGGRIGRTITAVDLSPTVLPT